jgi:trimeric autotransporter adhesin
MKTTTLQLRNLMNRSPLPAFLLIPFVLACFALSPTAQAVCQEGCDVSNFNTFLGDEALSSNTTGSANTAIGFEALFSNTTGFFNTANGSQALQSNTTGISNTANGAGALFNNTTGNDNTATGAGALVSNTTGSFNTVTGLSALSSNTTGFNNTANGWHALQMTTGSNNIAVGAEAGINLTSGHNNIDIGNPGVAGESRTIRIGTRQTHRATFIAGISGATVPAGVAVIVDGSGHLGTVVSSARFKDEIKPMDKASEAILALKPVTFRYKHDLDPESIPQFGLVAEEVEKVNPDLVARDADGKTYTVRYEAVNAMLLNEFLKEHRKVEALEKAMTEQQKENAAMRAMLKEQAAQIQKVSAQLELNKTASQIVLNNQ